MVAQDEECLYVPLLATFFGCQEIVQKYTLLSCRFITTCGFLALHMPLNSLPFSCSRAVLLFSLVDFLPTPVVIVTQSVSDMTKTKTGSAVQDSNASVELVSMSASMSVRYSTHSQARTSSTIPVPVKIRIKIPRTGLAPITTRIP